MQRRYAEETSPGGAEGCEYTVGAGTSAVRCLIQVRSAAFPSTQAIDNSTATVVCGHSFGVCKQPS